LLTLTSRCENLGLLSQPIGPKWQDGGRALCDQNGRKETAMTEIGSTLDPFIEAEIKEHKAALIRLCPLLMLVGFHQ
jgi:hypothetical protein